MNAQSVVLITGASTGLGRALALHYARLGWRVVVTARRQALLDELAESIRSAGGSAVPLVCDVAEAAQVGALIEQATAQCGRIDLAILNAGISERTDAHQFDAAVFERMCRTNLLGVAYGLQGLIPLMRQQGGGQIAVVSSIAGDRGIPGSAGYSATKAAVTALCDGLRVHLRASGIRLVTIAPGYVHTPMTAQFKNMPFVMTAEDAAALIARRLARGDRVIRFPFIPALFTWLMQIVPVALYDALMGKRRFAHRD
jgi:NAD(P)-dependent dehydrogenase (short-subunit alcohol dehydrogenase family)